jgi:pSer/pThr/pTyr-binding forkhead associated (FHA) protein
MSREAVSAVVPGLRHQRIPARVIPATESTRVLDKKATSWIRGSVCYLIDLDSSNGTYLRERPLPAGVAAKLRDGDQFSLAQAAAFELRIERQRA